MDGFPVDPADVRKLMLEEKKPSLGDAYVGKGARLAVRIVGDELGRLQRRA